MELRVIVECLARLRSSFFSRLQAHPYDGEDLNMDNRDMGVKECSV